MRFQSISYVCSDALRLGQALPVGLGLLEPQDLTRGLQISVAVPWLFTANNLRISAMFL